MAEFLLEILSEEIPARMQAQAAEDLANLVAGSAPAGLFDPKTMQTCVTPRRLTLVIPDLPLAQPDVSEERRGPRVGAPAQALDGFLKGAGVTLGECEQRDTGKGVFYFATITRKGRPTAEVLKDAVEAAMAKFPWPKSMRWGTHSVRWVRPIQSILALFDGKVVPVSFGPVSAGNSTVGHRFLAPARFEVKDFADYAVKLKAAKVMLDRAERKAAILAQAEALAAKLGLALRNDIGLLEEVTGLVECPVVLAGTIDDAFMDVPDEVLITSMRAHQKYFSLLKADGRLANRFLVVSNMEAADNGAAIVAGNERVLRARLSDARFFWDTDRKARLDSRIDKLAERLFYAKLGSMLDKAKRISELAAHIAPLIGADAAAAKRAGLLAKADLSSEMVGEFPELQGVMGRYYARHDNEAADIAEAIAEHYAPQGPNDRCPKAPVSVAVALADKIDSLVGFFAIDEKPTGSKDPFALRRAALGVIRLILENNLRKISLGSLFSKAFSNLRDQHPPVADDYLTRFRRERYPDAQTIPQVTYQFPELLEFVTDRLKVALKEKGVRFDLIDAVFALGGEDDLMRLLARVDALGAFLASEDGSNLLVAYRRAANIVRIEAKKEGAAFDGAVEASLLQAAEEQALVKTLSEVEPGQAQALAREDFTGAMAALAHLRRPVDAFFDKVTVNCDDRAVRINRLKLLARIGAAMEAIADFSRIEG